MTNFTTKSLPEMELTPFIRSILDQLDESNQDVETAITMPPEVYKSEEWFDFEKRAIWDKEWICVAHVGSIPNPGDYVSINIVDEPLLVVRGNDKEVRVLSAVCQHRGHVLGKTCGNATGFTCPFHHWVYDLKGTLRTAPEMDKQLPIEELREKQSLPQLRTEIWNGFVFANLDGTAKPLGDRVKRLTKAIENHDMGNLVSTDTLDIKDNPWNYKFMQENAIEPYHTAYLHKGPHDHQPSHLVRFTEWDEEDDGAVWRPSGFTHIDGGFNPTQKALAPVIEGLTEEERSRCMFVTILPNLFMGIVPDGVFYFILIPGGANKVTIRAGALYPKSTVELPDFEKTHDAIIDALMLYNAQDTEANAATHVGLQSRFAARSRYAKMEKSLTQVNRWLIKRYIQYAGTIDSKYKIRAA